MLFLASDHAGFDLKEKIKAHLVACGVDFEDVGAFTYDKDDDYPDFAYAAAKKVAEDPTHHKAIVMCGSGVGVAMAANKVRGVYCAQVWNREVAANVREHNNVNAIALGARYMDEAEAIASIEEFLKPSADRAERHARRFSKVQGIENN